MQNITKKYLVVLMVSALMASCGQRELKKESHKPPLVVQSGEGQIITQDSTGEDVVLPNAIANKDDLKIGILIGPGGTRTWAALGVLREFEKENIPIDVVTGMEWGAFIAALYSQKAKTHDAEWRSFKIGESFFKKGLLSSNLEPKDLRDLQKDLKTIFENEKAENSKVKFACGTDSYSRNRSLILSKGLLTEAMNYCLPYPPLVETYRGWNASALRTKPYLEALKNLGANYWILIDVTQGSDPLAGQKVSSETSILWMEIRNALRTSAKSFNQVIEVRLDRPLNDYKSRKEFIKAGERIGKQAVQSLKDQL